MKQTGQQFYGDDITGTSDAIVMASAPDVALPEESEPAAAPETGSSGVSARNGDLRQWFVDNPGNAIIVAAAAGLLFGVALKKSFRSRW